MDRTQKLEILADAAKYDASCAVTGPLSRKNERPKDSEAAPGVCYSIAADGRRLALLKILLTNECIFDCHFCINRRSSDVVRASFSPGEVVALTLDYQRRGLIEGLFLSSGVRGTPDETMQELIDVARTLRTKHHFFAYIHLKTIAGASPEVVEEAGRWADRLSVNIEMPRQWDLDRLAPEKSFVQITRAMDTIRDRIGEASVERSRSATAPRFAPAGQTTQMIVGASDASDAEILLTASALYARQGLRRIYYSAYVPIPNAPSSLPDRSPPALREQRLYQADWLIRGYGFTPGDLTPPGFEGLDLALDPKLAWALRNPARFPIDVNRAPRPDLLRVPGLGIQSVERVLAIRRSRRLTLADLKALRIPLRRAMPFIIAADHIPRPAQLHLSRVREEQLELSVEGIG